jgi:ABC transporter substrate binding protein
VIGWLFGFSAQVGQQPLAAFRKALSGQGYVEGRNVQIEYRWADGHYEKLPAMASDLVAQSVALIVTGGGDPPALAARAATATIPIVFVTGSDPVKSGLVPILNRAGMSPSSTGRRKIIAIGSQRWRTIWSAITLPRFLPRPISTRPSQQRPRAG